MILDHKKLGMLGMGCLLMLAAMQQSPAAWAEAAPHPLFCDGMVLQRNAEVPVGAGLSRVRR